MFTISDLKKHLGPGLGLRKNKYLLEIPVPGIEGAKINVLCQSAGLPERNISTTTIFHKGRKYNIRAETDYIGTYEVSIKEDSNMNVRKLFDKWIKVVDDSKPGGTRGGFSGASYEEGIGEVLDVAKSDGNAANQIKNSLENPSDAIGGFFLGALDVGGATTFAKYQTDINVWQLNSNNLKIYGYKLQNAFPSSIGIVTLGDSEENALSEFSVNFTFSEFIPLKGIDENFGIGGLDVLNDLNDAKTIFGNIESLFS
jgi:hypothetical protein